ncbi:DUF2243 domain-containing protein [Variovorax sp. J22G73]|uniref:DUF2243 domain-containing protein n=1 Tax=unclassified Variovorax TaxID=663243 RepID=UPI00257502F5|nr:MULTISPECIES: DUF2243 domain-containing protein [unclassified Variovorax]MDM0009506.1 DUF2243 domain-containing protein [Variovorax sp. J22R203]MDM0102014.1 DUF2243 domain-containing protein [Variovorax sp. J22G73]
MTRPNPLGLFPAVSGVLFGLGLGGFFDGIVLHQLLQWHHMLSSWYPPTTVENLRLNTLWDGIFHSATYVLVVVALYLLWRVAQRSHLFWSSRLIVGTALVGWGCFNLVEGVIDHHLLQLHHVNETVPLAQRMAWDLGFLAWGAAMLVGGLTLWQSGRREHRVLQADGAPHDVTPAA